MTDLSFYKNKKILITGHTGFKGSWMCGMLLFSGAEISGYSLDAPTESYLFDLADLSKDVNSINGDIRDLDKLQKTFDEIKPEIVIHMAAVPIVREGYSDPVKTYSTNLMGTVNVLECIRKSDTIKSFINVTTDKVYKNKSQGDYSSSKAFAATKIFKEEDVLDGFDPYSNSKSCSELATASYVRSFFSEGIPAISTVRSGNAIGGGDFGKDRIIPDCIRAVLRDEDIIIRNPSATRPYQHVLDSVSCYLLLAAMQARDPSLAGAYNAGPEDGSTDNETLVKMFCDEWNEKNGANGRQISYRIQNDDGPREALSLELDTKKIKKITERMPKWDISKSVEEIVDFVTIYESGRSGIREHMEKWINRYLKQ